MRNATTSSRVRLLAVQGRTSPFRGEGGKVRNRRDNLDIAACTMVSLISAAFMPDYTGKDISMEYDQAA